MPIAEIDMVSARKNLIAVVEQKDFLKNDSLSGGERRKISIKKAFAKSADLLILDEPDNNLDSGGLSELLQNILSDKHGVWLEHSEVYDEKWEISVDSYYPFIPLEGFTNGFNWLSKKMFDYRGLISLGLALPAPEGMYNGQNN